MADKISQMVIVAGGPGTRMASLSADFPKGLLPIGGKPVLQHQLELARTSGVQEIIIFAGHIADKIVEFVGGGSKFDLSVRVEIEKKALGTAGNILQSLDKLAENFFVVYGDIMLAVDLQRMAKEHVGRKADLTLFVQPSDRPQDSDLVETDPDGRVISIHSYPHPAGQTFYNLANEALYAVRRDALKPLMVFEKQDFVKDIIPKVIGRGGRVMAYQSDEYIEDMGTPARFEKVKADWQQGKIKMANLA